MSEPYKNRSYRKIQINSFRNLGISEPTNLVLNRTLDVDRLGGVIILIGPNNSGKSNVLQAVKCCSSGKYTDKDRTDFYSETVKEPNCNIVALDGDRVFNSEDLLNIDIPEENIPDYTGAISAALKKEFKTFEPGLCNTLDFYLNKEKKTILNEPVPDYPLSKFDIDVLSAMIGCYDFESNMYSRNIKKIISLAKQAMYEVDMNPQKFECKTIHLSNGQPDFECEFGFPLLPSISFYSEKQIRQTDLKSPYKPFSDFMKKALDVCNGTMLVADAYNKFEKRGTSGFLTHAEQILNRNVEIVADKFNDLYLQKNMRYSFRFNLMESCINFEIFMNDQPLDLDNQSAGFRWFFDFFFNELVDNEMKPGDVILMDEPATNLHVSGQIQLKRFMTEFAKKNGVTFIISTHSPFFIDCDCLDEVRLVRRKNDGTSEIVDKFSTLSNDPDQIDPILRSLTIGRHVIMDPGDKTVFVEGITDYNYLTAFKILLGVKGITFLPINGIRKEDMTNDEIIRRLRLIEKDPVLLVDGDFAGEQMVGSAEGKGIEVISLKDIDGRFKTIESLFKKEDLETFGLTDKDWNNSAVFKQFITENEDDIDEYTIKNFEKVLDYLVN